MSTSVSYTHLDVYKRQLQDMYVQQNLHMFTEYAIDENEPDAIIFDTDGTHHKAVWYDEPK